jgi:AraC family transcriptional regulator of adaptative response/methylated-DNA-[protein]-cysteine methyltransferase
LIGLTDRGICHFGFVQASEGNAIDELFLAWKQARMIEDQKATAPLVEPIFDMSRRESQPLRLHLRGTNFQLKVWEALLRIQPGSVTTYGHIADLIGRPGAMRAVGNAVGQNPVPVLIPCHRVIRKLGEFGNYRYGSARKKALLAWELSKENLEMENILES